MKAGSARHPKSGLLYWLFLMLQAQPLAKAVRGFEAMPQWFFDLTPLVEAH